MVTLDPTLILNQIVALAVVLLPVEAGVLSVVYAIRRQLQDPEARRQLMSEAAEQLWEPLKDPVQRSALIREAATVMWEPLKTPEQRSQIIGELLSPENLSKLGHGLLRSFTERAGSMKGAAVRSLQSEMVSEARESGDVLKLARSLPGKIDVPYIGKTSPGELLELLAAGRQLLSAGGGLRSMGRIIGEGSSTASGGYPP